MYFKKWWKNSYNEQGLVCYMLLSRHRTKQKFDLRFDLEDSIARILCD